MSKLEKLSIRGVRSFDPNESQIIEFPSPLTLIVGRNGTGKTTIIECLKYMTTGEMPPGGKGGAFVHDPRVAHETSVKAQLKLKFIAKNKKEAVCIRSIQLTQKKVKTEMKTLDGTLTIFDPQTQEQSSLSKRCSELDTEMPMLLGVSKAVLENVIFCHQEESNWPLADPTTLKKKFDDIFAVARYTKALDVLKSCRKEKAADKKVQDNELAHKQADKERADRLNAKVAEIEQRASSLRRQDAEIETNMETMSVEVAELTEKLNQITQLEEELKTNTKNLETQQSLMNDLEQSITHLGKTQEELLQMRQDYDRRVQDMDGFSENVKKERAEHEAAVTRLQRQLTDLATRKGQLEAEHSAYVSKIKNRNHAIQEFFEKHGLPCEAFTDNVEKDNAVAVQILQILTTFLREKTTEYEREKVASTAEIGELEKKIQACTGQIAVKEELTRNNAITTLNAKLRDAEAKLQQSSAADGRIGGLTEQLASQEAKLKGMREDLERLQNGDVLGGYKSKVKAIDDEIKDIQNKQSAGRQALDLKAKRDLKASEKAQKEVRIQAIVQQRSTALQPFGNAATDPIPALFARLKDAKVEQRNAVDKSYNEARVKFAQLDMKVSMIKSELETKQAHVSELEMSRMKYSHLNLERNITDEIETARGDVSTFEHGASLYSDFARKAKQHDNCPLCERDFQAGALDAFVDKISGLTVSFPEKAKQAKLKLQKLLTEQTELEEAKKVAEQLLVVEKEIETLELDNRKLEREHREAKKIQNQLLSDKYDLDKELDGRDGLLSAYEEVQRICDEIAMITREIDEVSSRLSSCGMDDDNDALEDKLFELDMKKGKLAKEFDRAQLDVKMRTSALNDEEKKYRDNRETLLGLEHQSSERRRLEELVTSLQDEISEAKRNIHTLESQINALAKERDGLNNDLNALKRQWSDKLGCLSDNLQSIRSGHQQIDGLQQDIICYQQKDTESARSRMDGEIKTVQDQVQHHGTEITRITQQLATESQAVGELQLMDRNLKDNLRYIRLTTEIEACRGKVDSSREVLRNTDKADIGRQLNDLQQQLSQLSGNRSSFIGQLAQLKENRRDLQQQIWQDYKDIDQAYRLQAINVKTLEMAIADLDQTVKTLDKAILQFHTSRMEKINQVIRRLWRYTYKGNDIDYIAIRSEVETARGNRSYNYRVTMMKGDTELDMRGRCSAGQRVLTSIIVRLALAETFCAQHCGVLALDEPTTNLDKENVSSLAESLNQIIELRRVQNNFQLVIITHDEEFLQELGQTAHADFFYQIDRGSNGCSRITRRPMSFL